MATISEALSAAVKFHQSGNLAEAERLYRKILEHNARHAGVWHLLGLVSYAHGDFAAAAEQIGRAIDIDPAQPAFHVHLGEAYRAQGRLPEAEASCRQAVALNPEFAEGHFKLGNVLQKQKRWSEAEACYRETLRLKPDSAETYNNLGAVYKSQGKLAEATDCFQRALQYRPDFVDVLTNLGEVFAMQGRTAESMICYQQALRMRPDDAQAHWNRGLALLAEGDFAGGWSEYEWRWQCPNLPKHSLAEPEWEGSPLSGRVLLVHAEQGLGDTLQFVRYVPQLAELGGQVLLRVQAPLVPLLEQSGFQNVIAEDAALPRYDFHVPLLSLPLHFGTTAENIPAEMPYLSAEPTLVSHWRDRLTDSTGFKVGIAWQGSSDNQADHFRSLPLALFEPLAQPGVELFSLQKGQGSEQLAEVAQRFRVRNFGDELDGRHGPFMDTAAIMMNLDLVITCDTATAHLAGALGVPVWVALQYAPDWRWQRDREDSPWYPTMRLFRQPCFGDWPPVLARMAEALRTAAAHDR